MREQRHSPLPLPPSAGSSAFFLSCSGSLIPAVAVGMAGQGGEVATPGVTVGGISSGLKPRLMSLRWTVWPVCLSTSTACWLVYPWMFTPSTCGGRSLAAEVGGGVKR